MKGRVKYTRNPRIDNDPIDNFRDSMSRLVQKLPSDHAIYLYTKHRTDYSLTYRQFYENVRAFGTALHLEGLDGKPVAIVTEPDPCFMTAYYAVIATGGVIVPLDRDVSDEEIVNFMKLAEVRAVIVGESQNARMKKLSKDLPDVARFICAYPEEEMPERFVRMEDLIAEGKKELENGSTYYDDVPQDLEKCCAIIFTSGTTGTSKGVMLSQKNLITSAMDSANVIDQLDEHTVLLSVLPMHHTYEVTTTHLTGQFYGATIAINDSVKYVSRNIKKYRPTYLVLVPLYVETMHKKIWEEIRKKGLEKKVRRMMKVSDALLNVGVDLRRKFFDSIRQFFGGRLDAIVCGGAKLNPQCIRDFISFGIEVQEGYGITECSPLLAANPINANRIGSVGPPVRSVTVRIDKDHPEDETGEIVAKGDNVMLGYYRNEEATAEAFTADGWFRTGDIGYLDKDGYIYITGRKKNVIILSNGKNVFPEELEEHLSSCPLFLESAVVGRAQDGGEPVITAVVYPDYSKLEGKTDAEIEEILREELNAVNRTLPQYKQMRGLEVRKTEFEKTTSRKIKRHKI
ncbi:MAG: AMP-binding protein [Clostridia bacterium]|nr:AMP-binding protein [Clostridia bacterium]